MFANPGSTQPNFRRWVSRDRTSFGYTFWQAEGAPQAVVIALHGLSGAASDFQPLGRYAAARGVTVYAYELRGQGLDPVVERRGDLRRRGAWFDDLTDFTALVRQKHADLPLFYYGESMGALIALHAAASSRMDASLSGLMLASPVVQLKQTIPWWQVGLLRLLTAIAPTYRIAFVDADRPPLQLTRDAAYQEWLQDAPHTLKTSTLRLLRRIENLMRRSHKAAAGLQLPVLILYAGHDALVAPSMVDTFFDAIASRDKEKHLFPNSYHLLLHDYDRAEVLGVIANWLQRQLQAKAEPR